MTIRTALREGSSVLYYAEIETPVLDAIVLLAEVLGVTKERLFASLPEDIDERRYTRFRELLDMRCAGIPVSYIRRKKEFYGIDFYVDDRVLVPRPESELVVEETFSTVRRNSWITSVHDVCTGSGCLAIVVKKNCPELSVTASDISSDCLDVFKENSRCILGFELTTYVSDILKEVPRTYDIIIANPPYLTAYEVDSLKRIGWPEPGIALRGGVDGTAVTERLIGEARDRLNPGGFLLVEASPQQMGKLTVVMESAGYRDIRVRRDLAGQKRLICGRTE